MVEKWARENAVFKKMDDGVEEHGWRMVMITRLVPVFPFNFQNYAYGLTRIPFWHYTFATLVGMIPGCFMYVYFGSLGKSSLEAAAGAEGPAGARLALQVVGLAATLLVTL